METMTQDALNLESVTPALQGVQASSPAYFAGLKRGQMIVELDGKPASSYSLDEARRSLRVDGAHPMTVLESGGKRVELNLELPSM